MTIEVQANAMPDLKANSDGARYKAALSGRNS